jgi:hypothetical protein
MFKGQKFKFVMARLPEREESRTLEFKKTLAEMREIVETVCAFANTRGGRVLIGVDDSGQVLGSEGDGMECEDLGFKGGWDGRQARGGRAGLPFDQPDVQIGHVRLAYGPKCDF